MLNKLYFSLILADVDPLLITGIIVGGSVLFLALVFITLLLIIKNKKKKFVISNDEWFLALGGNDNIVSVNATGSRLTLVLNDKEKINREALNNLGVTSVLVMSNKVTLVIEGQAENIARSLSARS